MDSEKQKFSLETMRGVLLCQKFVSDKLEIVLLYLEAGKSLSWLARHHGVSKDTLSNWIREYKEAGVEGLEESRRWTKYSKELKESAASD